MIKYLFAITSVLPLYLPAQTGLIRDQKIEFSAPSVYPEGVAFDPNGNIFYVSSVCYGTIGKVTMDGTYSEIYKDSTLKSSFGMKMFEKKLWFCVSDPHFSKNKSPETFRKMIRLICIDPISGKKIQDIDLSGLAPGPHFGNDLTIDKNGNKYISDSFSPVIYKVDKNNRATLFASNPLFGAIGTGLNGIAVHNSGYLIAVNSARGSILKIDIADPQKVTKVKVDQFFPGADGILFDPNGNLVLVQNKGVDKIFKLSSTDDWKTCKAKESTNPKDVFSYPSTATFVNADVWILNAKLNELKDSNVVESKRFSVQKAKFTAIN